MAKTTEREERSEESGSSAEETVTWSVCMYVWGGAGIISHREGEEWK